eukprot:680082_1
MIQQIDDCISTVQHALDQSEREMQYDHTESKINDINTHLSSGTMCTLHGLQNMPSKNGELCKIIGTYDTKQQRYPVYVYNSRETVSIKPCNLKCINLQENQRPNNDRMNSNIIYDMETGDPDDLFAILFLISHPRVNLRAITITPGTLYQVGAIRNLLFNTLKLKVNSIRIGSANPNHRNNCIPKSGTWKRVCGVIEKQQPDGLGCDIIHETITKYKDCVMVTGAPLTNLYHYVTKYCTNDMLNTGHKKKLKWVCQGGFAGDNVVPKEYRLRKFDGRCFVPTWNFNGNIPAAEYLLLNQHCNEVFDKRHLVSKNVCHGVSYNQSFHTKMEEYKDKHQALRIIYDEMSVYLKKRRQGKKFHDVLAAVAAINPKVVDFKQVQPCFQKGKGHEWGSKLSCDSNIFISIKYNQEAFFDTFVGLK